MAGIMARIRVSRAGTAALMLVSTLGACTSTRMDAPVNESWQRRQQVLLDLSDWQITGRIAVRDANEAQSSRIRWRQRGEHYTVNLWGALNIGATEITGSPAGVRLQQEGQAPLEAKSPEDLIREHLGYDLPVTNLNYWIKGVPAPGPATPVFNENNQLLQLQQSGWHIEFLAYTQYALEALPTRIRMEKPPLRLDFVRLDWVVGDDAPQ